MKLPEKKIRYSGLLSAIALALLPLAALWLSQTVHLGGPGAAAAWMAGHPGAVLLGWMLAALPAWLVYAAAGRLWAAWLGCALPELALTLVSFYKQAINGAPLELSDFSLLGQAGEIVGFALPQLRVTVGIVFAIADFVLLLAALIFLDRRLLRHPARRIAAAVCLGLCLTQLLTGLAPALAMKLSGEDQTQAERIRDAAVVGGLYCALVADRSKAEADAETVALVAQQSREADPFVPTETPTVIFLMSESFYDVTTLPGLEMEQDPIPTFHAIQQEHSTGRFVAYTHGCGTGYIELEVLTGLSNAFLRESDTLTSLPDAVYRTLPCITDVFDRYGYREEFLHSYNNAIYNRSVIYDAFGFDELRFDRDFTAAPQIAGGYLSDASLAREIIASYEAHTGCPQMFFAVSMENHQPYSAEKYHTPSGAGLSCDLLNEEELAMLETYVHGLADADASLRLLTEYFARVEEPVMIVFFGDHTPNLTLPDGGSVYSRLGVFSDDSSAWSAQEFAERLATDYVIWTNYGLEREERTVGSSFFGLEVLERLGFSLTDYYAWQRDCPAQCCAAYRPLLYLDREGNAFRTVPEEARAALEAYSACVRDAVYGGGTLFRHWREQ